MDYIIKLLLSCFYSRSSHLKAKQYTFANVGSLFIFNPTSLLMLPNNLAAFKRGHFVLKTPSLCYQNSEKRKKKQTLILERKLFSMASVTSRRGTCLFVLSQLPVLNLRFQYTSFVLFSLNLLLLPYLDCTAFTSNQPFN